jgi:hypothetical protein
MVTAGGRARSRDVACAVGGAHEAPGTRGPARHGTRLRPAQSAQCGPRELTGVGALNAKRVGREATGDGAGWPRAGGAGVASTVRVRPARNTLAPRSVALAVTCKTAADTDREPRAEPRGGRTRRRTARLAKPRCPFVSARIEGARGPRTGQELPFAPNSRSPPRSPHIRCRRRPRATPATEPHAAAASSPRAARRPPRTAAKPIGKSADGQYRRAKPTSPNAEIAWRRVECRAPAPKIYLFARASRPRVRASRFSKFSSRGRADGSTGPAKIFENRRRKSRFRS